MPAPPYDTLEAVLNLARVRLNDAIAAAGGDVFTDAQPFTQTIANQAWRKLQKFLADLGYVRITQEAVVTNIPIVTNLDPAAVMSLSWAGGFDGTNPITSPTLPPDLIQPMKIWERWTGVAASFCDPPMICMLDGLPSVPKNSLNLYWEWREDGLYFPGSLQAEDFRIRYKAYLPDFNTLANVAITAASNANPVTLTAVGHGLMDGETVTITGATGGWTAINGAFVAHVLNANQFWIAVNSTSLGALSGSPVFASVAWQNRLVPMVRCESSLANFMCAEMAKARGDLDGPGFTQQAEDDASKLMNRDVQMKQRVNVRRQPRSGRNAGSGWGLSY